MKEPMKIDNAMGETIKKIGKIQAEIGKMTKEKTANSGSFSYNYFDINQLLDKLKPLLQEYDLVLMQPLVTTSVGEPAIKTVVYDHAKEKSIEAVFPLPKLENPQDMGKTITYMRRYALQSLFALEAEDDDDSSVKKTTTTKGDDDPLFD